ncbi:hypothetical protein T458_26760 [Brevibacillus panacihumi W25]|uniref:Uncharacterized protein n=1 Tax=Brevibacillus panacihumi W25 TaxID=1408254 RepID=V6M0S4_9BACL|nr:hypothetical protein T458_26760 [Brevibacillus panacihumi W25]
MSVLPKKIVKKPVFPQKYKKRAGAAFVSLPVRMLSFVKLVL